MYKTATKSSNLLAAAAASLALMSSAAAVAGPGKPGINDILEGGNIAEIALAANGALDEFNLLLEAVLCFGPLENNPVVDLLSSPDKITLFAPAQIAGGGVVGVLVGEALESVILEVLSGKAVTDCFVSIED